MLQTLYIENIAVIEKCSIDFNSGLNVLTGETGAGKSILLGALGLIAPATSALLHNSSTLLLSMDCLTDLLPE